ncbi:hypothetical protein EMPS_07592 [Entomortierella parvispora]|uniref:Uncharacterized protein n=1 Tax=Entomortierella parvispora TaxID=205924 RepID=A0A9P3LYH8_9FUNG|nr:hypothetical protein EMPS_07592 [Entomortierella parvispora]
MVVRANVSSHNLQVTFLHGRTINNNTPDDHNMEFELAFPIAGLWHPAHQESLKPRNTFPFLFYSPFTTEKELTSKAKRVLWVRWAFSFGKLNALEHQ